MSLYGLLGKKVTPFQPNPVQLSRKDPEGPRCIGEAGTSS